MALLLIPIVWLAVIALVVVLCRMAARSDALLVADTTATHHHDLGASLPRRRITPPRAGRHFAHVPH